MAYLLLQLNLPPIRAKTLLAGPPLPRPIVHTLWMTPQYIVLYGNME